MSDGDSNDPTLEQEVLAATQRLLVENYCIVASSALLFFDCAITFTHEVKRIWMRRTTGATAVFLLTRYSAVLERITLLTSLFLQTVDNNRCVPVLRIDDSLTDISYASIGAFTALRLYGIYNELWPAVLIGGVWVSRISIAIYLQVRYMPIAFGPPLWGCGAEFLPSPDTVYRLDTTSNALVLSSDVLLLVLTWIKTLGIRRTSSRLGMRAPLSTLLLRDGTVYFGAILVIQIFAIVSSAVGSSFILFDVWVYFAQVFNVIFLCRFMLNLRGIYLVENAEEESVYPAVSEVHFATVVGNLGAPLDTSIFDTRPLTISTDGDTAESSSIELSSNPMLVGLRSRPPALDQDHIEMQDSDGKFMTSDQNGDGEGGASSHEVNSPHQQRS